MLLSLLISLIYLISPLLCSDAEMMFGWTQQQEQQQDIDFYEGLDWFFIFEDGYTNEQMDIWTDKLMDLTSVMVQVQ